MSISRENLYQDLLTITNEKSASNQIADLVASIGRCAANVSFSDLSETVKRYLSTGRDKTWLLDYLTRWNSLTIKNSRVTTQEILSELKPIMNEPFDIHIFLKDLGFTGTTLFGPEPWSVYRYYQQGDTNLFVHVHGRMVKIRDGRRGVDKTYWEGEPSTANELFALLDEYAGNLTPNAVKGC